MDRAIANYDQAISLDPKFAAAYYLRRMAYYHKYDNNRAIADYTQAISINPKFVAAYNNRGIVYRYNGDYDRAIADFSWAISLDPKEPAAYTNRGNAYYNNSDNDRAIADFTQAISVSPKYVPACRERGLLNFFAGSPEKALADLNQASALDPKDPYTALWVDIVSQRSNLPGSLPQTSSRIDMTAWPAALVRLFMGQVTAPAVLAAADDPDANLRKVQVCEANFYTGELSLLKGTKEEATRLFRLAASDCWHDFIEWSAAKAELKALGVSP